VEEKVACPVSPIGSKAGELTEKGAAMIGLCPGTAVAIGNVDAHVCVPAVKITGPNKLLAIMGTSTCHVLLSEEEKLVPGICGVVEDGVLPDYFGYEPHMDPFSLSFHNYFAPITGALPNGRKLGDPLADAGISPHASYDKNGPMAAVISASKIDHRKQKANIFNQKFSPACIEGEAGRAKLKDYITAGMDLGLDMIQFNVVDGKVLREAQKHPENYKDLVVRISGYNANFVDLDKFVQDAVIQRTEHMI